MSSSRKSYSLEEACERTRTDDDVQPEQDLVQPEKKEGDGIKVGKVESSYVS